MPTLEMIKRTLCRYTRISIFFQLLRQVC